MLLVLIVLDFKPRHDWERIETRHMRFEKRCSAIQTALDRDARLASTLGFHLTVFLKQPVYSLLLAIINASGDVRVVEEVIDRYEINTIILTPDMPGLYTILDYAKEYYPNAIEQIGLSFMIRVRP